jgi:ligand-binding sensor domain-containing protein/two-component sensor histidine kinase
VNDTGSCTKDKKAPLIRRRKIVRKLNIMAQRFSALFFSLLFTGLIHISAQQLIFQPYTVQEGLVANPVRKIFQDSKGFIWFITWEGISKYDGHQFTNFTRANGLSSNVTNDVSESKDGKLYVAQNDGTVDIIQNDLVVQKAVFQNIVINNFITTTTGKVIAATDARGLYEFINGKLIKLSPAPDSSTSHKLAVWKDSLIVGIADSSLLLLNNKYAVRATFNNPGYHFESIYGDSRNRLWAGTTTGLKLLTLSEQNNWELTIAELPVIFNIPLVNNSSVTAIYEDADGVFWIGMINGLIRVSPDGNWRFYSDKDGLPSAQINCIFQDSEKNIWIGTSQGVAKIVTRNNLQVFASQHGSLANVFDVCRLNNKQLLILSTKGVQLFSNTSNYFEQIKVKAGSSYTGFLKKWPAPLLYGITGNVTGSYNSINKSIGETPSINMITAAGISHYHYFAGTMTGLYYMAEKKIQAINQLPYRITGLAIDKTGDLWMGTWDNGLYKIRYKVSRDSINVESINNLTLLPAAKEIRSLFIDSRGNIWAGTRYNGVICLSVKDRNNYEVKYWDSRQGLLADFISAIQEDSAGNIWLGSNLGIDKLVKQDTGYRIFNFSRVNNFFAAINAIIPDTGNRLWMATNRGLLYIEDGQMENLPPPSVYLTSVLLGTEKNNFVLEQKTKNIRLGYRQNQALFEFSAPSFINEKQVLYSYRLKGSEDTSWSRPANIHSILYANLQPGHYRFEVRSLGWNRNNSPSAFFDFIIQPPFWKTGWFILLCLLIIAFCIYLFNRYRINQLVKLQQVRNRIATDLHDDIGSSLTNISILTELSKNNIHDPEKSQIFIERIGEEVNNSCQALDDIVWSIDTHNDSLQQVTARMRRFASEMFDGGNVSYYLEMEEQFGDLKLNMEQRRDIFLIFKEALNNIHKHAAAKNVMMKLEIENRHLHMVIADNGKGFDTNIITNRHGIKSLHQRISRWKGNLRIESAPGKGTIIAVHMPLKTHHSNE